MSTHDAIVNLITTYNELNISSIDELAEEPTSLEFLRYVAQNRPFVVRGAALKWDAVRQWNAEYLRQKLEGKQVCVAVTPEGNADAVVEQEDGSLVFVQPYEVARDFSQFLDDIQRDSAQSSDETNVQYAQTQNDNLRNEYCCLFSDVQPEVPFARIGLDREAEAVNFWLGTERSTTALHKDNYENVYVQVRGKKHFTLLSPVMMPCVNEKHMMQGRYMPSALTESKDTDKKSHDQMLRIELDDTAEFIPVPTWDPDEPYHNCNAYSHLAQPLRVTLDEGDILYLPAMWFHKVGQSVGNEGFALSVNYWYDMDFSGGFWASNAFVRDVVEANRSKDLWSGVMKQPSRRSYDDKFYFSM